jgi:hypothetical protein
MEVWTAGADGSGAKQVAVMQEQRSLMLAENVPGVR